MPTLFTHAFVAGAILSSAPPKVQGVKLGVVLVTVSILPDLDVLAFWVGIPYTHPLGHRGFSHSLTFAGFLALLTSLLAFPHLVRFSRDWWMILLLVFLATASHGVLDCFTDSGRGIGLFIPFNNERYFFPWRPIPTAAVDPRLFFQPKGLVILAKEMLWIWFPAALLVGVVVLMARAKKRQRHTNNLSRRT